jgi:ATP adenylyltransferase
VKQIWAPWRMAYLEGDHPAMDGCVFCRKVDREGAGEDQGFSGVLYRGRTCYVVLNRYPYSNGHLMIVPYRHVGKLVELEDAVLLELLQLTQQAERILREVQGPQGFNIGMNEGSAAGAGIEEHLHLHVVPRWAGDANYMTVVGETRVIPQMLQETYALLRPHFDRLAASRSSGEDS